MASQADSAMRRKAKRRGVELVRSRIKDDGCVQFGKWSLIETGSGDVFAGLRDGQPVWLDALPENAGRTAWLDASEVARLLDEVFSAKPARSVALNVAPDLVRRGPVMVPDGSEIADLRLQADIARREQALAVAALTKAMNEIAALKAAPELPGNDACGRSELRQPDTGTVCEALAAMGAGAAAEVLATGLGPEVLRAWVKLAAVEIEGEGAAIVAEVFAADPDALTEALDTVWSAADWHDAIEARTGDPIPDPQAEALHSLLWELQPAIDDAQANMMPRAIEHATAWLRRVAYDPRVNWI